jgi:hypothetical protein
MTNYIGSADSHSGWRASLQKLGGNLAGMVIPNIEHSSLGVYSQLSSSRLDGYLTELCQDGWTNDR